MKKNTVSTTILENIKNHNKKKIKTQKSLTLDNILHPYDKDKSICDDNDFVIITINRKICWSDCNHKIEKVDRFHENKKRSLYDNIKIKHYIKIGEMCAICLDEIYSINNAFLTDCGHAFHASCLNNHFYVNKNRNCPVCRFETDDAEPLLINKYFDTNFLDKLDDFWANINILFPQKCFSYDCSDSFHGYSTDYHDLGMIPTCDG